MGYQDYDNTFSDDQDITGATPVESEDNYDAGAATFFNQGEHMICEGEFTESGGGADVTVIPQFIGADNEALTSNPIVIATQAAIALDEETVQFAFPIGGGKQSAKKRYYGMRYPTTGTMGVLTVKSRMVRVSQSSDD